VLSRRAGRVDARGGRLLLSSTALAATVALVVTATGLGRPWPGVLAAQP
jgi:hypothetical protein